MLGCLLCNLWYFGYREYFLRNEDAHVAIFVKTITLKYLHLPQSADALIQSHLKKCFEVTIDIHILMLVH